MYPLPLKKQKENQANVKGKWPGKGGLKGGGETWGRKIDI